MVSLGPVDFTGAIFTHDPVTDNTLSKTQYDWRKIEQVTMEANFIHFSCVKSKIYSQKSIL